MPRGFQAAVPALYERRINSAAVMDRRYRSEPHLHPAVDGTPQRGKPENLSVMLIGQIVDPSKDRHVQVNFIFGRNVHKTVIFYIEIWSAEINFFARIHKLRRDRRAQFIPPKIGTGNIDFVAWPSWHTRALWLRNVG